MNVMWFAPPAVALAAKGLGLPGAEAIDSSATRGSDEQFDKLVAEFTASTVAFPNVPPNARDPYTPPERRP